MPNSAAESDLRNSFLPPIVELEDAADWLSRAADALLAGDRGLAEECLIKANIPAAHAYASHIMGGLKPEVHRYRKIDGAPPIKRRNERLPLRMPRASEQAAIYARDGYRCRYCGCRVVLKSARDVIRRLAPDALPWGSDDKGKHAAFYALLAVIDHLVPHSRGGTNDASNMVTSCWPCNFGKMEFLIEELGLTDPRMRPPLCNGWDGLSRVLGLDRQTGVRATGKSRAAQNAPGRSGAAEKQSSQDQTSWSARFENAHPGLLEPLMALVASLQDLGVSYSMKAALILRMTVKGQTLEVLGVSPDGATDIPWLIGNHKDGFRIFAETLAAGIPGAIVYETPKMWRVKGPAGRLHITEVLNAAPVLRLALESLETVLSGRA